MYWFNICFFCVITLWSSKIYVSINDSNFNIDGDLQNEIKRIRSSNFMDVGRGVKSRKCLVFKTINNHKKSYGKIVGNINIIPISYNINFLFLVFIQKRILDTSNFQIIIILPFEYFLNVINI